MDRQHEREELPRSVVPNGDVTPNTSQVNTSQTNLSGTPTTYTPSPNSNGPPVLPNGSNQNNPQPPHEPTKDTCATPAPPAPSRGMSPPSSSKPLPPRAPITLSQNSPHPQLGPGNDTCPTPARPPAPSGSATPLSASQPLPHRPPVLSATPLNGPLAIASQPPPTASSLHTPTTPRLQTSSVVPASEFPVGPSKTSSQPPAPRPPVSAAGQMIAPLSSATQPSAVASSSQSPITPRLRAGSVIPLTASPLGSGKKVIPLFSGRTSLPARQRPSDAAKTEVYRAATPPPATVKKPRKPRAHKASKAPKALTGPSALAGPSTQATAQPSSSTGSVFAVPATPGTASQVAAGAPQSTRASASPPPSGAGDYMTTAHRLSSPVLGASRPPRPPQPPSSSSESEGDYESEEEEGPRQASPSLPPAPVPVRQLASATPVTEAVIDLRSPANSTRQATPERSFTQLARSNSSSPVDRFVLDLEEEEYQPKYSYIAQGITPGDARPATPGPSAAHLAQSLQRSPGNKLIIDLTSSQRAARQKPTALGPMNHAFVVLPMSRKRRDVLISRGVYDPFRDDWDEVEPPARKRGLRQWMQLWKTPRAVLVQAGDRPARIKEPEEPQDRFIIRPGPALLEPWASVLTKNSLLNRTGQYTCGWKGCGSVLASEALLARHVKRRGHAAQGGFDAGYQRYYRCHWRDCPEQPCFDSVFDLSQHMTAVHISKWLQCPYEGCDLRSPTISHLQRHGTKQHDEPERDLARPRADVPFRATLAKLPPLPQFAHADELTTYPARGTSHRTNFKQEHMIARIQRNCFAGPDPVIHFEHPPHMMKPLEGIESVDQSAAGSEAEPAFGSGSGDSEDVLAAVPTEVSASQRQGKRKGRDWVIKGQPAVRSKLVNEIVREVEDDEYIEDMDLPPRRRSRLEVYVDIPFVRPRRRTQPLLDKDGELVQNGVASGRELPSSYPASPSSSRYASPASPPPGMVVLGPNCHPTAVLARWRGIPNDTSPPRGNVVLDPNAYPTAILLLPNDANNDDADAAAAAADAAHPADASDSEFMDVDYTLPLPQSDDDEEEEEEEEVEEIELERLSPTPSAQSGADGEYRATSHSASLPPAMSIVV